MRTNRQLKIDQEIITDHEKRWCPRGTRRLARTVIDRAIADLQSDNYYVQKSAIDFFEDEYMMGLIYSLAELGEPLRLPKYKRVSKPVPRKPKQQKARASIEVLRHGRVYRSVLGLKEAERATGLTESSIVRLMRSGKKSREGWSFRRKR